MHYSSTTESFAEEILQSWAHRRSKNYSLKQQQDNLWVRETDDVFVPCSTTCVRRFVRFSRFSEAEEAVRIMNGVLLDGKQLVVTIAKSRSRATQGNA